jgi:hypothetical protein
MPELTTECVCGCEYESHLTNINTNPEGEPSYEELGCRECALDAHPCTEFRPLTDEDYIAELGYAEFVSGLFV